MGIKKFLDIIICKSLNKLQISSIKRAMLGDKREKTLNYSSLKKEIVKEAEMYNRMYLATSFNNQVHGFYPLCVFIDLKAYVVFGEKFIWVKEIERNPNVVLNTYNKQYYGRAKILGDPYDDQFWRIRIRFREKHRIAWDRCVNIPRLVLIEIKIKHVTIMDYDNEYVPYWRVKHLDVVKKEAFWHYIFEKFPYWHQLTESTTQEHDANIEGSQADMLDKREMT
jgi:hypothetical protein